MKVFIQAIVGQLLLSSYIFIRGYQAIPPTKKWRVPFTLFFILEISLYLTGFFFRKSLPDSIFIPIMQICNTWYIASLYLTMSLLVLELIRFLNRYVPLIPQVIKKNYAKTKLILFFTITAGVTALMFKAYHTVTHPVVRHVSITLPKKGSTRDSLKIVMMSDLHIGETINRSLVHKYVALANEQKADMAVLVGDIMDYESRIAVNQKVEEELRQIHAPLGTYIVLGNHEYRANINAKHKWLLQTGGTLLIDSVAMPDSTFYLVGRDDLVNKKRKPLHSLTKDLDPDLPVIVLDHQPLAFNEMVMNKADLGLHGHTHNGQFWPYPLIMKLIFECPYGYYKKGDTQFYVSSGIGCAGPPYRVGTVSELVVLHITFR
ncbi:metallophosphoesterase [Macellibacteroides fermentans]|jgi:predicted MPP superfamily phosphohydrolase|uniref:metallophosphoesterase n=1 Tax=Macellibacteroides fermentans TaxID=879969 RepID=UPI002C65B1B2|nr:metallophosphoesterase [Macellibacteroides fermentans]HNP91164.1 metallophosphoesterase [Macellibacteroides fermentans]